MATRTNLCRNPCDGISDAYWNGGSRVTGLSGFLRTTGHQYTGGASAVGPKGVVLPSTAYIFSAYVRTNYTGTINVLINWMNGSSVLSSTTVSGVSVTNNVVTRVSVTGTSHASATSARINITSNDSTLTITAVLYELGSTLKTYFDGDSPKAEWNGWDDLSTSSIDDTKVAYHTVTAPITFGASAVTSKRVTKAVSAPINFLANAVTDKRVTHAVTAPIAFGSNSIAGLYHEVNVEAPIHFDTAGPSIGARYKEVQVTAPIAFGDATETSKYASATPEAPIAFGASAVITRTGGLPALVTRFPKPPITNPFRVIAQRILTREIVDWDLPVSDDFEFGRTLTGPSIMKGSFKPEIISVQELGLDPYAYFFHVEIDNQIRGTGILLPPEFDDSTLNFECEGFSAAPHYSMYESEFSGIDLDPLNVVREIWNHVQSRAESQYGVVVSSDTSTVKLGDPATTETDDTTDPPTVREIEAKPYTINWWDNKNCGAEIDSLASETPFDYLEMAKWNTTKTNVDLSIKLGFPRVGIQRTELLFVDGEGENILGMVPVQEDPDHYASAVFVIGAGEGRAAIRGYAGERLANRVRRTFTVTDKSITTVARANAKAREQLLIRKNMNFDISEITIKAHHDNAPLGSYDAGDDILVRVYVPWLLNETSAWYRILAWSYQPSRDLVRLTLARSDSFTYGTPVT